MTDIKTACFYFSPSRLVFVAGEMKEDYVESGSWPEDAVPVSEEVYAEFVSAPPEGKIRGADSSGMPCWVDVPPPTREQQIELAQRKLDSATATASAAIAPLQDAVDLDMATDAEKNSLLAWKKYRVLLSRIDVSAAPDIDWPQEPARITSVTD